MRAEVERAYQEGGLTALQRAGERPGTQVERDVSRFLGIRGPTVVYHPEDIAAGIPAAQRRVTTMIPRMMPSGDVTMELTESLEPSLRAQLAKLQAGQMSEEEAKLAGIRAKEDYEWHQVRAALSTRSPRAQKFALRNLLERGDAAFVEEKMNEVAAEMGHEGGRIVEHVGGALEWVPHGPGGIPQPPTGDVFHDPIAEEQEQIMAQQRAAYGYARGGRVKKFQNGGIVSALVPEAEVPDPREELLGKIRLSKEDALAALRAQREELTARRAQEQEEDERSRWLALAQGMLAPTRTGGFGEALGATAGLMRQEHELSRKRALQYAEEQRALADEERDIEMDALRAEAGLLTPEAAARTMGSTVAYHPEDTAAFNRGDVNPDTGDKWKAEDRRLVQLQQTQMPDGTIVNQYARDPETDDFIEVPSTLMPGLMGAVEAAKTVGQFSVEDIRDDALGGLQAARQMPRLLDARDVFNKLAQAGEITSGLRQDLMRIATYFGFADQIDSFTDLATAQKLMGRSILDELQLLTGPKSDFEFQKVSEMLPNIASEISVNQTTLNKMIERYQVVIDEGEHSARRLADDWPEFAADYAARYERYRNREAEREADRTFQASREASPEHYEILIQQIRDLGPEATKEQHDQVLDFFQETWDIDDDTKVILREMDVAI